MSRDKTRAARVLFLRSPRHFHSLAIPLASRKLSTAKQGVLLSQVTKRRQNALFRFVILNRTDPPVVQSPADQDPLRIPQRRQPEKKPVLRHPLTVSPSPQLQKRDVAGERVPRPQHGHPPPDLLKNHLHGHLPSYRHPPARHSCTSGAASTRHGRHTPCGWWRS